MLHALSPEITDDYQSLKSALLSGFNKTTDSDLDDFKAARIGSGETYQQSVVQLGRLFDHWFDSRGIPKSFEDLREFLIVDQLFSIMPVPLRMYIKEQDKHLLCDITKICDSWSSADKGYKNVPLDSFAQYKSTSQTSLQSSTKSTSHTDSFKTTDSTGNRGICYGCGKSGHLRRYCPFNPGNYQIGKGNNSENVQFCLDDKKP